MLLRKALKVVFAIFSCDERQHKIHLSGNFTSRSEDFNPVLRYGKLL